MSMTSSLSLQSQAKVPDSAAFLWLQVISYYIKYYCIMYIIESCIALIISMGAVWGEEVMNWTQNSFSSISWGKFIFDIYIVWCLFHCLEIFPDTSSIKIMRGIAYTMRPWDLVHNRFSSSLVYLFDDGVSPHASSSTSSDISLNDLRKLVVGMISCLSLTMNPSYMFINKIS
jgi:hypothetical protein